MFSRKQSINISEGVFFNQGIYVLRFENKQRIVLLSGCIGMFVNTYAPISLW